MDFINKLNNNYLFCLLVVLILNGCSKEKKLIDPGEPNFENIQEPLHNNNTATVKYQLSTKMFSETGAVITTNQSDISNPNAVPTMAKGVVEGNGYKVIFQRLALQTKYWYRLYYVNRSNQRVYGEIRSFTSPAISLTYADGYGKKIMLNGKTSIKFVLEGPNLDPQLANYRVKLVQLEFPVLEFEKGTGKNGWDRISFQINYFSKIGLQVPLIVTLNGITAFSDQLDIVNDENLTTFTTTLLVNLPVSFSGVSVAYQDKIYYFNQQTRTIDPMTGTITSLGNTPYIGMGLDQSGAVFNGEIYFTPDRYVTNFVCPVYNIANNTWREIKVLNYLNSNGEQTNMSARSLFVHKGKLYLSFKENPANGLNSVGLMVNRIQVYDSSTATFSNVMTIDKEFNSFKMTTRGDKIYMIANSPLYDGIFRYAFTQGLFEVDLDGKRLSLIKYNGEGNDAAAPGLYSFFTFKDRLFFYTEKGLFEYLDQKGKFAEHLHISSNQLPLYGTNFCVIDNILYLCKGYETNTILKTSIQ